MYLKCCKDACLPNPLYATCNKLHIKFFLRVIIENLPDKKIAGEMRVERQINNSPSLFFAGSPSADCYLAFFGKERIGSCNTQLLFWRASSPSFRPVFFPCCPSISPILLAVVSAAQKRPYPAHWDLSADFPSSLWQWVRWRARLVVSCGNTEAR